MLLTISNLFPRPDHPQRGLFNAQLFREFAAQLGERGQASEGRGAGQTAPPPLLNLCLVPEWRKWRWSAIRRWKMEEQTVDRRPQTVDAGEEATSRSQSLIPNSQSLVPTLYLPVFYLPRFGRDRTADTYYRSLQNLHVTVRGTRGIFAAWLYPDGVASARLARDLAVPCWIMVQGSDVFHLQHPRRLKALMDAMDDIQGFVCVSRPLAETLVKAGVDRSKVHVVPNGVDRELFKYRTKTEASREVSVFSVQCSGRDTLERKEEGTSNAQRSTLNVKGFRSRTLNTELLRPPAVPLADIVVGRRKLVLFVGNLVPVKGPDVFLKSVALLQPAAYSLQPIIYVVIGEGPMRSDLERAARRWGLADTVYFLGSRPHDEVARWMNLADVMCLTSRSEGMPNVVIEALVSGLPVVVTDVGASRELVENEPMARWCLSEDTRALARATGELASQRADRPAMAARHGERFSWSRQAGEILQLMGMGGQVPT